MSLSFVLITAPRFTYYKTGQYANEGTYPFPSSSSKRGEVKVFWVKTLFASLFEKDLEFIP